MSELTVYQPWDPLKLCVVGKNYQPEFYNFIKHRKLRALFQRIALETEEDMQFLEKTLNKLGVKTIRPNVPESINAFPGKRDNRPIPGPLGSVPRDQMIVIGNKLYVFPYSNIVHKTFNRYLSSETSLLFNLIKQGEDFDWWSPIWNLFDSSNIITNINYGLQEIPANGISRIGTRLVFGKRTNEVLSNEIKNLIANEFPTHNCVVVDSNGHLDGCFSPVVPGLIVSIREMSEYSTTFPDWEVVYLENESWNKIKGFSDLKKKNGGKWWIPGYENDNDLINFVETWLKDWVGYVEETVFDVNMLTVDTKNVIVSGYNKKVFNAFERYGITPHICPLRHRYFWDGGIHCSTLDLHREGIQQTWPVI
jgi:hypothetical protein